MENMIIKPSRGFPGCQPSRRVISSGRIIDGQMQMPDLSWNPIHGEALHSSAAVRRNKQLLGGGNVQSSTLHKIGLNNSRHLAVLWTALLMGF